MAFTGIFTGIDSPVHIKHHLDIMVDVGDEMTYLVSNHRMVVFNIGGMGLVKDIFSWSTLRL